LVCSLRSAAPAGARRGSLRASTDEVATSSFVDSALGGQFVQVIAASNHVEVSDVIVGKERLMPDFVIRTIAFGLAIRLLLQFILGLVAMQHGDIVTKPAFVQMMTIEHVLEHSQVPVVLLAMLLSDDVLAALRLVVRSADDAGRATLATANCFGGVWPDRVSLEKAAHQCRHSVCDELLNDRAERSCGMPNSGDCSSRIDAPSGTSSGSSLLHEGA